MNDFPVKVSDVELRQQRERIRGGLLRANAAAVGILCIVMALAIGAVVAAWRADKNAQVAFQATRQTDQQRLRAEHELWQARLAQAQALRMSGQAGRRGKAMDTLREAARVQPTIELRNEVIASLALMDLEPEGLVRALPDSGMPHAFDPALEHFAAGRTNGDITIHRFSDAEEIGRLPAPAKIKNEKVAPWRLQFSGGGEKLGVVYEDGSAFIFESKGTNPPIALNGQAWVSGEVQVPLVFSADGRWAALVRILGIASIYDLETGGRLRTNFSVLDLRSVAFHPRKNWLALGGSRQTRVLDWTKGQLVRAFTNEAAVSGVSFRQDGKQLAVAAGNVGLSLWDLETGESTHLSVPTGTFHELNYSPAGTYVSVAMGEGVSSIWDSQTGRLLHKLPGSRVSRFSADEQRIAVEKPQEGVATWRLSPREAFRSFRSNPEHFGQRRRFWGVDISEDGRWLAAVDDINLTIWDIASGRIVATKPGLRRLSVFWLRGQQAWLVSGHKGIAILPMESNAASGQVRFGPERVIKLDAGAAFGQASLAPDGLTLAVVTQPNRAVVFDLAQPDAQRKLEGPPSLGHLVFSPDNKWIASSSTSGDGLLVWSAQTGELKQKARDAHGRVAWSPDGKWVLLGTAREYAFWNTDTWQKDKTRSLSRGNLSDTTGPLTYSSDGQMLAVARSRDLVQLINAPTGEELATLTAPEPEAISWLRFSADGKMLAAATFEGTVQLWNLRDLRDELARMNLDWQQQPLLTGFAAGPAAIQYAGRSSALTLFVSLALLGVILAVAAGLFAFQRQRQLLAGYRQMDALAAQRSTELEAAQTEIIHSQKMKALGTLAAGIAHDFNNLLSVIRMSNQLTGAEAPANEEIKENVAEVEQAVEQGKKLVRSMLGYSRQDSEEKQPLPLAELVEDTVALLSKQFLSGIALTLELERDLPPVKVSRSRTEQILLNLVVNASEAMRGKGSLHISLGKILSAEGASVLRPRGAPYYLKLEVADSGPGISPEIMPRIFEPFFTTKNRGAERGTGLGLSMVYTMAEQDGFGIGVGAQIGQGTTFRIFVPGDEIS